MISQSLQLLAMILQWHPVNFVLAASTEVRAPTTKTNLNEYSLIINIEGWATPPFMWELIINKRNGKQGAWTVINKVGSEGPTTKKELYRKVQQLDCIFWFITVCAPYQSSAMIDSLCDGCGLRVKGKDD